MKRTLILVACALLAACAADPAGADLPTEFHADGLVDIDKEDENGVVQPGFEDSCGVAAVTSMIWAAGYETKPDGTTAGSADELYRSIVNDINASGNEDWSLDDGWTFDEEKAWLDDYTGAHADGNPYTDLTQQTASGDGLNTSQLQRTFEQLARKDFVQLGIKPEDSGDHFVTLEGFEATVDANGVLTGGKVFIYDSNGDLFKGGKDEYVLKEIDGQWYLEDFPRSGMNAAIWSSFRLTPIPGSTVLGVMGLGLVAWTRGRFLRK